MTSRQKQTEFSGPEDDLSDRDWRIKKKKKLDILKSSKLLRKSYQMTGAGSYLSSDKSSLYS